MQEMPEEWYAAQALLNHSKHAEARLTRTYFRLKKRKENRKKERQNRRLGRIRNKR